MGFPDRIERTVEIAHPPARVWAALTTAEGLGAWFGNTATIDLRPGGSAEMTWGGGEKASMRIERVEEPTVFGFTWGIYGLPDDDPRHTYVEFTLEPTPTAGPTSWGSWSCTSMPRQPDLEAVAEEVFTALADPSRRKILAELAA